MYVSHVSMPVRYLLNDVYSRKLFSICFQKFVFYKLRNRCAAFSLSLAAHLQTPKPSPRLPAPRQLQLKLLIGGGGPIASKWCKVVQSDAKWCKVMQSGAKWCKVLQNGAKCAKWCKVKPSA